MGVISNIRFILNHPLNRNQKAKAFSRFVKWQVNSRLSPHPIIYPFTEKAKLIVQKGMTGATGNLYCGLHDFEDMGFILHFLRKEDCFIDIGANVGSYSILASAHVGATTISIEPVRSTFEILKKNIFINQVSDKVKPLNIALGSKKVEVRFTTTLDTMNHVAVDDSESGSKIELDTLDNILSNQLFPAIIKIDVEGFEIEVIKGAPNTLSHAALKAIIIELNGSGKNYGFDENAIHTTFLKLGFLPFTYDPFLRKLLPSDFYGHLNTIYIRDLDFVEGRLKNADKLRIFDHEF